MKNKVAILTYYRYPCTEPALETIFAREIGRLVDTVIFCQGNSMREGKARWHSLDVSIGRGCRREVWYKTVLDRLLRCDRLIRVLKLLIRGDIGIVMVRDLPLEALILSGLRKIFRFKLYFQCTAPLGGIDIEASKYEKGLRRRLRFIQGCISALLLAKVLPKADLVFPISDTHNRELSKYADKSRLVPIPMGVDLAWRERLLHKPEDLEELKCAGYLLLGYLGNLNGARNPRFMLEVFSAVRERFPKSKLVLIGGTDSSRDAAVLDAGRDELGLSGDVIVTGYVQRDRAHATLSCCNVSISAVPPVPCFRIMSPTKVFESLGCGVPVVANTGICEQERLLTESGGGLLVPYEAASFAKAVIRIGEDPELRERMAESGRNYVFSYCNYQSLAKEIAPLFVPEEI